MGLRTRLWVCSGVAIALVVGVPIGAAAVGDLQDGSPNRASALAATPNGKLLWIKSGCGACHTMKAARARGTVGPNLDRAKPSRALVIKRVTNGKGAMPSFKFQLTKAEIAALATYVANGT